LGFKPSYYLHGAYWHNQFGIRPMSHGCVNIAYKDVEKLYAFMDVGDKVVISGKTPKRVQIASVAL
jgi:lipoprotein-anchoring transpeptidase ErfK/SrfK